MFVAEKVLLLLVISLTAHCVKNDLRAVDIHLGAAMVLLDISAAFDTIDWHRLLHTLESSFGIQGNVLEWLQSYLYGHTQAVHIKKCAS